MKLCNQKIVMVDGIAGCGKSFFGDSLAKKLGCCIIHGDSFMFDGVGKMQSEMKQIFGTKPGKEDPRVYINRNLARSENIEQRRELFIQTRDYVEERAMKFLKSTHSELVIFEW